MVTPETVYSITIPQWVNKVPMGTIIADYYSVHNRLPKRYEGATVKRFGKTLYYIDAKGKKILRNPTKVGNTEYWRLNGQQFYSANMHHTKRTEIKNFYKSYFTPYIKEAFPTPFVIFEAYRITMQVLIYEVYTSKMPDITNMWILPKLFEDCVVSAGTLRDDSPAYRNDTNFGYRFVEKEEDRKLVITFAYTKDF